jgi:signal peptidase I
MNFALLMLLLLAVTGGIWLLDRLWLGRRRQVAVRAALTQAQPRLTLKPGESDADYQARKEGILREVQQGPGREPWWLEYSKSFFPVILIVFLLRSFLVEPFKIPSGSMIPTLLVGDFILVNKYTYGIRLPVINMKVLDVNQPQRGDVMVFRYPENPSLDYIKRVVGVPGDKVVYRDKRLSINGQPLPTEYDADFRYFDEKGRLVSTERYRETLGQHNHPILVIPSDPPLKLMGTPQFPQHENCEYNADGIQCVVPPGHYFMMGDNRDSSSDSRYWGFVPERNIVGKAFIIWWNFSDFGRIGKGID